MPGPSPCRRGGVPEPPSCWGWGRGGVPTGGGGGQASSPLLSPLKPPQGKSGQTAWGRVASWPTLSLPSSRPDPSAPTLHADVTPSWLPGGQCRGQLPVGLRAELRLTDQQHGSRAGATGALVAWTLTPTGCESAGPPPPGQVPPDHAPFLSGALGRAPFPGPVLCRLQALLCVASPTHLVPRSPCPLEPTHPAELDPQLRQLLAPAPAPAAGNPSKHPPAPQCGRSEVASGCSSRGTPFPHCMGVRASPLRRGAN